MQDKHDQQERYPDLPKSSDAYRAHEQVFREIFREVIQMSSLIRKATAQTEERRRADSPAHLRGQEPDRRLPPLGSIDKEYHVNCKGAQILFHHVGLEAYRKENDDTQVARLRPVLELIASTRLSIVNFDLTRQPVDHSDTIRGIDVRLRELVSSEEDVPSLVPYYFTPNSTMTALKGLLGSRKFEDPELLMDLGFLFASDDHVLHAVCMTLATHDMPKDIELVLQPRAETEFPRFGKNALIPLFQKYPDLFVAHVVGLVESEQTKRALEWCHMQHFRGLLTKRKELALKYVAALRHQGRFQEAMNFCRANEGNPDLRDRKFQQEFRMAVAQCPKVSPMTLEEFERQYPRT